MSYELGDKVISRKAFTTKVGKGQVGEVVKPLTVQPELYPWRVKFVVGSDSFTLNVRTDEIAPAPEPVSLVRTKPKRPARSKPRKPDFTIDPWCDASIPEGDHDDPQEVKDFLKAPVSGGGCNCPGERCQLVEPLPFREADYPGPWGDERFAGELPQFDADVAEVFYDAQALLLQKHLDYGPKNISQSPGGALNGLRVRMHDKLARINHLVNTGAEPENESLKDSFIDLLNYAAIGVLVLEGRWPNE